MRRTGWFLEAFSIQTVATGLRLVWQEETETLAVPFMLKGFEFTLAVGVQTGGSKRPVLNIGFIGPMLEDWPSARPDYHSYETWLKLEGELKQSFSGLGFTHPRWLPTAAVSASGGGVRRCFTAGLPPGAVEDSALEAILSERARFVAELLARAGKL